jgi:hypothetical protein
MRALFAVTILLVVAASRDLSAQNELPAQNRPMSESPAGRFQPAGIDDSTAAIRFFERFRDAVIGDRKKEVLAMLSLPIRTWLDGRRTVMKTTDDVLRHYRQLFNTTVREALRQQDPHDLSVMEQGVMVGRGEVWFAPCPDTLKVIAINNL